MATTESAFVRLTSAQLVGSTVVAAGTVIAVSPATARQIVAGGTGTRIDASSTDLATGGYAKNGSATVTLTGTTPVTINLLDLTSATASSAGDTVFATVKKLVFSNLGAGSLTLAPGGSNPFDLFLAGTTPTITLPAGSTHTFESVAGKTLSASVKTILITPAADTTLAVAVGGT